LTAAPQLVFFRDVIGKTPLHEAACSGNVDEIDTLIRLGAEVDATDMNRRTPLHFAWGYLHISPSGDSSLAANIVAMRPSSSAEQDLLRSRELLIERGANPDARDDGGHTPSAAAFIIANLPSVLNSGKFGRLGTQLFSWEHAISNSYDSWYTHGYNLLKQMTNVKLL
jgi:ankyrin repeat protein